MRAALGFGLGLSMIRGRTMVLGTPSAAEFDQAANSQLLVLHSIGVA